MFEEEDTFGFTFQEVGKRDATKTLERINELDSKLYHSLHAAEISTRTIETVHTSRSEFLDQPEIGDSAAYFRMHRFDDQNQDEDGTIEVNEWARNFHFLRAEGSKITCPKSFIDPQKQSDTFSAMNKLSPDENSHYFEVHTPSKLETMDLSITGTQIPVGAPLLENDEENFSINGVLEEVLALDCSDFYNNSKEKIYLDDAINPEGFEDREAVLTLRKKIWPVIVDTLRPFVEQVLTAAQKHNVVFMETANEEEPVNEGGDNLFADGGDEYSDWE